MIICGVDCGKTGALWKWDGYFVSFIDMPTDKFYEVDGHEVAEFVTNCDHAFIEWCPGRTGQAAGPTMSFGKSQGIVKGACDALSISVNLISPKTWCSSLKVVDKKLDPGLVFRQKIFRDLWPDVLPAIFGPKGGLKDGRLDAALICYYGLKSLGLI